MTGNRVAKLEATAVTHPWIRAAREASRPKTRMKIITLRDDQPAPPHKGPGRPVILRIITTSGPRSQHGPGRERVLRTAEKEISAPRPAGQEKAYNPGEGKPARYPTTKTHEPTLAELEAELAALEAEILDEERRAK